MYLHKILCGIAILFMTHTSFAGKDILYQSLTEAGGGGTSNVSAGSFSGFDVNITRSYSPGSGTGSAEGNFYPSGSNIGVYGGANTGVPSHATPSGTFTPTGGITIRVK